jgi:hypothetical protein
MHRIRVHDELSVSGRAESVRDALEQDMPHDWAELEFITYLHSLQECLCELLSAGVSVRSNPYFISNDNSATARGYDRLRLVRSQLVETMLQSAERLSDATMAQAASGWNVLMLIWCVVAQLSVAIERTRDDDLSELDESSLRRNEVMRWSGTVDDVQHYSMLELVTAIDVLRDRLNCLDTIDSALVRYILSLELRAAHFVTRVESDADEYNARVWIKSERQVTLGFVAACSWWFVWLKRYVHAYLRLSSPRFFSSEVSTGCVRSIGRDIDLVGRASVIAFVEKYAASLNTDAHQKEFLRIARQYTVAPGDLDEHTYVYGMNGVERASIQDVVGRKRTPEGTTYVGIRQFNRPLVNWVRSIVRRAQLMGRGRFVGGGASCEALFEQLAVLHCVNALFVARLDVKFVQWFVITMRAAGPKFEQHVQRAISNGWPFLVQRCGRWACVVPAPTDRRATTVDVVEALLGLDYGDSRSSEAAATLYDGSDVFDALTVWFRFMIECWDGRIGQSSKRRLRPLLERIFAENPVDAILQSEASRARTDLASAATERRRAERSKSATM